MNNRSPSDENPVVFFSSKSSPPGSTILSMRFHLLPIIISTVLLFILLICTIFYIFQDRYINYLPSLSELGIGIQNSFVFSMGGSVIAYLLSFEVALYSSSMYLLESSKKSTYVINRILNVLIPVLCLTYSCTIYQQTSLVNEITLALLLLSFFIYILLSLYSIWSTLSNKVKIFRNVTALLTFIATVSQWASLFSSIDPLYQLFNPLIQYVFVVALLLEFTSWSFELSKINLDVVVIT